MNVSLDDIVEAGNAAAKVVNVLMNSTENKKKFDEYNKGSLTDMRVSVTPTDLDNKKGPTFTLYDHNKDKNRGDRNYQSNNKKADFIDVYTDPVNKKIKVDNHITNRTDEYGYDQTDIAVKDIKKGISMEAFMKKPGISLANIVKSVLNK